ncbi:MAG: peptidylprolyl isomerase [Planctomycetota bacterium]
MPDPTTTSLLVLSALFPQDAPHPPQGPAGATPDPVIATVGDQEIRLADLIDEVNRQIPLNFYHRRVPPEQMVQFQREAFDKLVVKHLIHLDALEAGLVAADDELHAEFDAALREAGRDYTGLEAGAKAALFAEVHDALERRVLIRKNEERIAARLPQPDEARMRTLYDDRIAEDPTAFMAPKEAHFFHLFVAVDPARIRVEEAEKRAKIEAALAEVRAGKPFATVARLYSEDEFAAQGGDIGYQQAGSFRMKALGDEAFELQAGQTSAVIRSLHGFHLLHCTDVRPPVRRTFAEMRPAIEQWLRDEHLKLARGRWLAELRGKHPVRLLRPDVLEAQGEGAADRDR